MMTSVRIVAELSLAAPGSQPGTAQLALRYTNSVLFKALSAAVYGLDANIIDVEVDFSGISDLRTKSPEASAPLLS